MSFDLKALETRMEASIESLRKEFAGLRTGRASPNLVEPVQVEAYGGRVPLSQVGTVSVADARMLTVTVWDRTLAKAVEKGIRDAGLGLNPIGEGNTIRVPIPDLTAERRAELAKAAGRYAEGAKVAIRNIRRDGMDALKKMEKDKTITEDEHKAQGEKIQKSTDAFIKRVDEALAQKEKDIKQV